MSNVFLSHSSHDDDFAGVLKKSIEQVIPNAEVFASPDAIPSGIDWRAKVFQELDCAKAMVVLLTQPALASTWVGFEVGYFWDKRHKEQLIHILHHPTVDIPNPLNDLQAKRLTDLRDLEAFFQGLCNSMDVQCPSFDELEPVVTVVAKVARSLRGRPPERSLARFEYLLDTTSWEYLLDQGKQVWICSDDVFLQIVLDLENGQVFKNEEWIKPFLSPLQEAAKYLVKLMIGQTTVATMYFCYLDGDKYLVPLPEIDSGRFFWRKSSLRFKVAKQIGKFAYWQAPNLETFAEYAGIDLHD